jgi:hypothetical protein
MSSFKTSSPHSSCSSHERPRQLICNPTISTRFAFTAAVAWGLLRKTGAGARSGADAEGAAYFAGARIAASVMSLATRLTLEVLDSSMRVTGEYSFLQAHARLPHRRFGPQTQIMSAWRVVRVPPGVPPDNATSLPSSPRTPLTSRHRCRCRLQTWCAVVSKRGCAAAYMGDMAHTKNV